MNKQGGSSVAEPTVAKMAFIPASRHCLSALLPCEHASLTAHFLPLSWSLLVLPEYLYSSQSSSKSKEQKDRKKSSPHRPKISEAEVTRAARSQLWGLQCEE